MRRLRPWRKPRISNRRSRNRISGWDSSPRNASTTQMRFLNFSTPPRARPIVPSTTSCWDARSLPLETGSSRRKVTSAPRNSIPRWRSMSSNSETRSFDPKMPDIEYLIGYCYRVQGKLDEARSHFEAQLKMDSKHVRSLAALGFLSLEEGRPADALEPLEQAVVLDPDNVDALFDLGRACEQLKQSARAMEYFEHVLQLRPDDTQAHYHLYLLYSRNGRPTKAKEQLAVYQRLVEMDKLVRREESALSNARKARAGRSGVTPPGPDP